MKNGITAALALLTGLIIGFLFNFGSLDGRGISALPANNSGFVQSSELDVPTPSIPIEGVLATAAAPSLAPDLSGNRPLLAAAYSATAAIKARDYGALSFLIHPVRGVTFTPYTTVDFEANLTFSASDIAAPAFPSTKYIWGITDGKGDPIELTADAYFSRYVFDADYTLAPVIGIDRVIGTGNALENVTEAYSNDRFVEFYYPGFSEKYEGLDWCSLTLVFEYYNGSYFLVGIIHGQWTV